MAGKVNLADKLALIDDHGAPRIVARYNDHKVRLVKVEGEVKLLLIDPREMPITGGPATATIAVEI